MVIQELKPSKRVRGRWLAVLEDGSLLRVGEGEVIQFALCAGRELTEEEAERLQAAVRTGGLKEKALNLLAGRPMSRRELERKLESWEAAPEEATAICGRLEELGFLNDALYAEQVVRHYSAKGYGLRKLRDELYRRGVPRELWDEALERAEDPAEAIDAFLAKKLGDTPPEDRRAWKRASDALARHQRGPAPLWRGVGGVTVFSRQGESQLVAQLSAVRKASGSRPRRAPQRFDRNSAGGSRPCWHIFSGFHRRSAGDHR